MGDFRSGPRREAFVGTVPSTITRPSGTAGLWTRVLAGSGSDRLVARRTAELADTMSTFLGVANRPATGSNPEQRLAQGQRVRAEFTEVFGSRLKRACRDLKRQRAMSEDEDRIIGLALEGSNFGLHAIACFLADRARQLVEAPASGSDEG
jgi:hypothetical protein